MKYFIITLFCILLICCKKKEAESPISLFEKKLTLNGRSFNCEIDILGNPRDILVYDTIVIVNDYYNGTWLNIINKNTGKQISKCLKIGKGPNEITFLAKYSIDKKNKQIKLFDAQLKRFVILSIESIKSNSELKFLALFKTNIGIKIFICQIKEYLVITC